MSATCGLEREGVRNSFQDYLKWCLMFYINFIRLLLLAYEGKYRFHWLGVMTCVSVGEDLWARSMNLSSLLSKKLLPVKSPAELVTWFDCTMFLHFYLFISFFVIFLLLLTLLLFTSCDCEKNIVSDNEI